MATRKKPRQQEPDEEGMEEEGTDMEVQNPLEMLKEDHQTVQGLFFFKKDLNRILNRIQ